MFSLLVVILLIVVSVLLVKIVLKTQSRKECREPVPPIKLSRWAKYLLFVLCSVMLPFVVTIFSIMLSGSRTSGMAIGFTIPFFLINFGFAFVLLSASTKMKIIIGTVVTIVTLGLMWLVAYSQILEAADLEKVDAYGVWRMIILFNVLSIAAWEIVYRINKQKMKSETDTTSIN